LTTETASITAGEEAQAPGRNGVVLKRKLGGVGGYYRTYEIYGRHRLKDSQHLFNPRVFLRREHLLDPYAAYNDLRAKYECYRDWINNCHWVARYNEVTSVFADEANFESRSKLWFYQMEDFGRDLRDELPVLWAWARGMETAQEPIAAELIAGFAARGEADLIGEFTYRYPIYLLASTLGLPRADWDRFGEWYRAMMDGWQWEPRREVAGKQAIAALTDYLRPIFEARRREPGEDLVSAVAALEIDGAPTTVEDLVTTVLEYDGETLFGGLSNMWFQLLRHPDQLAVLREDALMVKRAWQETLRHSTPILQWRRFARHEVERWGWLIPEGGIVMCSAAAANRDERIFENPDSFDIHRKDLCYREPRGQYRADGLPAGVAFGLGKPSIHPAIPEDRPRSVYAITMELAVTASKALLAAMPNVRVKPGTEPVMFCRWPWDIHTCWDLQVVFDRS
jgi:pulcherriminic acid synthase